MQRAFESFFIKKVGDEKGVRLYNSNYTISHKQRIESKKGAGTLFFILVFFCCTSSLLSVLR